LVGFSRAAAAPADRNLTQLEISGGMVYRGPIPGRDWDSIALAGSYLQISDDIRDSYRELNDVLPGTFAALPDYEGVVELSYRAQMTAWWALQASIERAIHPSGKTIGNVPDAWALVLASTLRF
jgi:porin